MARFPLMDNDHIPRGVQDHCHTAYRSFEGLDFEGGPGIFQRGDRGIEIHRLKPATRTVGAWKPSGGFPDRQRVGTEFIFHPASIVAHWLDHCRREAKDTLLERARSREIRDRVTGKGNFGEEHGFERCRVS